ncbi:hypothetical protein [Novosphingobium olei]|uniref:hypothetical protein n=1 Tax=Novosphingobium olei TaxID=2728851 RepID=UPI00308EA518|nr:hypothetical protein NSDW_33280 [Novosphingobium olei]
MLITKLARWRAFRSGNGLSVTGTDTRSGRIRTITGIKLIEPREGRLLAIGPEAEITLKA